MKRILSLILAALMLFALVACAAEPRKPADSTPVVDTQPSTQPTEAPTDEPAEEPAEKPVEEPAEAPADEPEEEPAEAPAETPEWDPAIFNLEDDIDKYLGLYAIPGDVPSYNLPLTQEDITLTYFHSIQWVVESGMDSLADNEMWQKVMEMTGINIEFVHPSLTGIAEQFSLMFAGNDLTDLIQDLSNYVTIGSLDTAVEDEFYVDLAQHQEYVPHLMAVLNSSENLKKNATTDSGYIPMFPEISYFAWRLPESTFAVRQDMLDAGGYTGELPETFDELHDLLVWFRDSAGKPNAMGLTSFTSMPDAWLLQGLGMSATYYLDNGQVKYALISDEYRTLLEYLSDWYAENLIQKEFFESSIMNNPIDKLCMEGSLALGWIFTPFCADEFAMAGNPNLYLSPLKSPVVDKDNASYFPMYEEGEFSLTLGRGTAVNAECAYLEEALRFMDFFYSDQGALMANYGIREASDAAGDGLYYHDENGTPMTTDWSRNYTGYGSVEFHVQYPYYWIQMNALDAYSENLMNAAQPILDQQQAPTLYERRLPDNYALNSDEGYTFSSIMSDINTYVEESVIHFIVGDTELNDATWTEYVQKVESMNIQGAMDCLQAAVDRYEHR